MNPFVSVPLSCLIFLLGLFSIHTSIEASQLPNIAGVVATLIGGGLLVALAVRAYRSR